MISLSYDDFRKKAEAEAQIMKSSRLKAHYLGQIKEAEKWAARYKSYAFFNHYQDRIAEAWEGVGRCDADMGFAEHQLEVFHAKQAMARAQLTASYVTQTSDLDREVAARVAQSVSASESVSVSKSVLHGAAKSASAKPGVDAGLGEDFQLNLFGEREGSGSAPPPNHEGVRVANEPKPNSETEQEPLLDWMSAATPRSTPPPPDRSRSSPSPVASTTSPRSTPRPVDRSRSSPLPVASAASPRSTPRPASPTESASFPASQASQRSPAPSTASPRRVESAGSPSDQGLPWFLRMFGQLTSGLSPVPSMVSPAMIQSSSEFQKIQQDFKDRIQRTLETSAYYRFAPRPKRPVESEPTGQELAVMLRLAAGVLKAQVARLTAALQVKNAPVASTASPSASPPANRPEDDATTHEQQLQRELVKTQRLVEAERQARLQAEARLAEKCQEADEQTESCVAHLLTAAQKKDELRAKVEAQTILLAGQGKTLADQGQIILDLQAKLAAQNTLLERQSKLLQDQNECIESQRAEHTKLLHALDGQAQPSVIFRVSEPAPNTTGESVGTTALTTTKQRHPYRKPKRR